jgi:hypothetical protein
LLTILKKKSEKFKKISKNLKKSQAFKFTIARKHPKKLKKSQKIKPLNLLLLGSPRKAQKISKNLKKSQTFKFTIEGNPPQSSKNLKQSQKKSKTNEKQMKNK